MKEIFKNFDSSLLCSKKFQYGALAVTVAVIILILVLIFAGSNKNENNADLNSSSYLQMDTVNKIDIKCQTLGTENQGGDEFSSLVDLNGDGNPDSIKFYCEKDEGAAWAEDLRLVIEINNTPFALNGHFFYIADYSEDSSDEQKMVFKGIPDNLFYLIDVDKKDSFVEIAISYKNEYNCPQTNFYRYDGTNLIKVSQLYTYVRGSNFDYNGKVIACTPLIDVVKWFGDVEYTFEADGSFTKIYKYYEGKKDCDTSAEDSKEYLTVKIKDFLFAYSKPDDSKKTQIIESQSITLLGSDEKNWVKFKTEKGKTYWFKCSLITESDQAFLNDMGTNPAEVFEGEAVDNPFM